MRRILTLLALTAVVVSCQKEVENPPEPTNKRVTISPVITLPAHSPMTRATELSFEPNDKIGVTIIKEDQTAHIENAPMTFTDGVFSGDVTWYEGTDASKMTAYYPYSSTGVPTSFTVSTDQTTGYSASDLMGAVKPDAVPANDAVSMTFKHLLTKIVVNMQSDEDIRSVVLRNSIPTATVDFESLTVTADQTAAATDITAQSVTAGTVYRAVIVPQTVALTIAVTSTDGETYTHKLASAALKGGGQYSIDAEISSGDLIITSVSGEIEDWTDGDEIEDGGIDPNPAGATAYITKVLDYMPAVGQFTNALPFCGPEDTQETMNAKVLNVIGNNKRGMITLGGFGGYVTVGFDHTIANVAGKRDFRVIANAFYADANPNPDAPLGGSCEPGVIVVSYDANKNGKADDPWYEIAGSAHEDPKGEAWYQRAKDRGNIAETIFNYEITYYRPEKEPASPAEWDTYIRWEDNQGNSGYKVKNEYYSQPYYPIFAGNSITFRGTCLPQNGINEAEEGSEYPHFVLYQFHYGYADNAPNTDDESAIDIDWAVNAAGEKVHLPGVDFIKIYTGVNQENGWIGECSTEFSGIEDLHVLGKDINTRP